MGIDGILSKWWSLVPFQWSSRCCHTLNSSDEKLITLRLAVLSDMLTVSSWVSWKYWDIVLQAGGSQRMWMGVCGMIDLGASSGQMSVIPDDTAVGAEVIIQTFGVIDVGILTLLAFPICSEHHFLMLSLSLAHKAVIHVGGLTSGRRGVFKLQNGPLAWWHVLNWSSEISTGLVLSWIMPKYPLFML